MSKSLRDQLLGLGYQPAQRPEPQPERKREPLARERPAPSKPVSRPRRPPASSKGKSQEEIDLGRAYALRAQKEKDERIEAERVKQDEAGRRREAKAKLSVLLQDKALNDPAAEIARHFEYGGKIKRVYVTARQLTALNAGELGVAQMDGRYLLIPADLLLQAEAIFPAAVALKVNPDAKPTDDPYSDPAYQIPDDLIW